MLKLAAAEVVNGNLGLVQALLLFEGEIVQQALTAAHGNQSRVARHLGVHRNTLTRRIAMLRAAGLEIVVKRRRRARKPMQAAKLHTDEAGGIMLSEKQTMEQLREEFHSRTCPTCGGIKRDGQPLCANCYHALPPVLQSPLYRPMERDYAVSVATAKQYLAGRK